MKDTVLFGNGLNRISVNSVSWDALLDNIKSDKYFKNETLPNTMVYERIFLEKHLHQINESEEADELKIKSSIAEAMKSQGSNDIYELLASMNFDNYITTNYDYAFEQAIGYPPELLSTEEIYSLRRKRSYKTTKQKTLWNIHGEIDHPKSIMLGLDHYCGSVSKIDSYIKGRYKYKVDGETKSVIPMMEKLKTKNYCHTSWIDLFFSSHVHIIGFTLDYSETDIWWLLNKRARFSTNGLVRNKISFYADKMDNEKKGLLKSFGVEVVITKNNNNYKQMYKTAIDKMLQI